MTKIMSDTTFFAILLGGILVSSGVLVGDAYGAVFAKYADIKGESNSSDTNDPHHEWIEVLSIDWGMHKKQAKKTTPAKNVIDVFQMTMEYEKSSPKLLEAALTGKAIPKLVIELTKVGCLDPPEVPPASVCREMGQVTYLRYELTNVLVTSYDVNGSGGSTEITPPPTVEVSNNFEEIKVTYTEYDNDTGINKGNVETEHKIGKGE